MHCMPSCACSQVRAVVAALGLQRCPGCTALIGELEPKETLVLLPMTASHPGCPARMGSDNCSMRHAPTLCLCNADDSQDPHVAADPAIQQIPVSRSRKCS